MIKTKTIQIAQEVVDDIICNICEKSLLSACDNYEGLSTKFCGGYGSKIGDMTTLDVSICEQCLLDHIIPMMKISPYVIDNEDEELQ